MMKQFALLIGVALAIYLLWPYPVFFPLKLLVVFFHESSHALMTLVTGGQVIEFVVNEMQGGHVISRGGSRFLILSAGYLGSLLWGAVIYLLAVRTQLDKAVMVLLGVIIISMCGVFIRTPFALAFGLSVAAVMLVLGLKASRDINDLVLRVIGLTSILYVPLDIYSDTIERSGLRSDAYMLAEEFGGAGVIWGGAWLLISLAIAGTTLYLGFRHQARQTSGGDSDYTGSVDYDR
jgi:hypothetical protein